MDAERDDDTTDALRVSVIVPVWEPGPAFDDLLASLDRQSLPADRFELLLCDDGSGPATRERLEQAALGRPYVRVLLLGHTGWPGTPRNAGIDAARGRYVFFVDQDDYLFDGALEGLCDFADRHGSDVVVGREVGVGRRIPARIFRRDIPDAKLGTDPILDMLTPHKMFRTAFLREHGIRFPDGKVRLEDHLFVMQAYFAATTISVLASIPCYAWVKHEGSASSSRIDPETYFPHLETVLDVVVAHTEPGELRDTLLRHWLRGKILKRLSGAQMLGYPDDYRENLIAVVAPLVRERFGPGVDAGLSAPHRLRVSLLRADRGDDLLRLARFEAALDCEVEATSAAWSRGGGLDLRLRVRFPSPELDVADEAATDPVSELIRSLRDPAAPRPGDRLDLLLHEPGGRRRLTRVAPKGLRDVRLALDPLRVFGPEDTSRGGGLVAQVRREGWSFEVPVTARPGALDRAQRSPLLAGRRCAPVRGADGTVELRRAWPEGGIRDAAGRAARRIRRLLRRR